MDFAGGAAIFGAFIVFYFFVFAYSTYTRRGSAINQHPYRDPYGDAPGAWRKSTSLPLLLATSERIPSVKGKPSPRRRISSITSSRFSGWPGS